MAPYGIQQTEVVTRYLRRLAVELGGGEAVELPDWSVDGLEELHFAVKLVKQAIENKRQMKWSVVKYVEALALMGPRCTGMQEHIEDQLREIFPPESSETIAAPCVVVDSEGIILLWFLPGLLNPKRQATIWNSLPIMEKRLQVKLTSTNWRVNGEYYRCSEDCEYIPGTVNYGLAWYQQGMKGKRDMEVAAELRKPPAQEWIAAMQETNTLIGAVAGLIHPPSFNTGIRSVKAIGKDEHIAKRENLPELMSIWTSPFVAASLINNRDTPLHRDNGATYTSMDILASVGPFEMGRFTVPSLGYKFLFTSGAIIGLLGRVVPHAAKVTGERLCYAQYLRENILDTLAVEEPGWINIKDLV